MVIFVKQKQAANCGPRGVRIWLPATQALVRGEPALNLSTPWGLAGVRPPTLRRTANFFRWRLSAPASLLVCRAQVGELEDAQCRRPICQAGMAVCLQVSEPVEYDDVKVRLGDVSWPAKVVDSWNEPVSIRWQRCPRIPPEKGVAKATPSFVNATEVYSAEGGRKARSQSWRAFLGVGQQCPKLRRGCILPGFRKELRQPQARSLDPSRNCFGHAFCGVPMPFPMFAFPAQTRGRFGQAQGQRIGQGSDDGQNQGQVNRCKAVLDGTPAGRMLVVARNVACLRPQKDPRLLNELVQGLTNGAMREVDTSRVAPSTPQTWQHCW